MPARATRPGTTTRAAQRGAWRFSLRVIVVVRTFAGVFDARLGAAT